MRLAFFPAPDTPFLRRRMTACSRSPLASDSACLQSIIGAPVFSRSSLTCAAEIFTVDVLIAERAFPSSEKQQRCLPSGRSRRKRLYGILCLTNFDPRRTTRAGHIALWG